MLSLNRTTPDSKLEAGRPQQSSFVTFKGFIYKSWAARITIASVIFSLVAQRGILTRHPILY